MARNPYRAPHPVFDWRETPAQLDWSDLNKSKRLSTTSAAKVANEREQGVNNSVIHGLSKKSDVLIAASRHGGAYGRAVLRTAVVDRSAASVTEVLRTALKDGPKTASELATVAGIETTRVPGLMKYDRAQGRATLLKDRKPYRYALAGERT